MARKRKTPKPPEGETKKAKFVRVVEPRVAKAIKVIGQIGNCAGAGYEYNDTQANQICKVLATAINQLSDKFAKKTPAQETFKLTKN